MNTRVEQVIFLGGSMEIDPRFAEGHPLRYRALHPDPNVPYCGWGNDPEEAAKNLIDIHIGKKVNT